MNQPPANREHQSHDDQHYQLSERAESVGHTSVHTASSPMHFDAPRGAPSDLPPPRDSTVDAPTPEYDPQRSMEDGPDDSQGSHEERRQRAIDALVARYEAACAHTIRLYDITLTNEDRWDCVHIAIAEIASAPVATAFYQLYGDRTATPDLLRCFIDTYAGSYATTSDFVADRVDMNALQDVLDDFTDRNLLPLDALSWNHEALREHLLAGFDHVVTGGQHHFFHRPLGMEVALPQPEQGT